LLGLIELLLIRVVADSEDTCDEL